MPLPEIKLVKIWLETSKILQGKLDVKYQRRYNANNNEGLYLLNIDLTYKNIPVNIHSEISEFPMIYNEVKSYSVTYSFKKMY